MTPIKKETFEDDGSKLDSQIAKEKAIRDQLSIELDSIKAKSPSKSSIEDEAAQRYIVDQAKQAEISRLKCEQDAIREEIAWRKGRK
jgi:hypothetical protein